jgi:P pilus assembly chaperone PapD
MKYLSKWLLGCLFISCCSAQASVVLGGTRIIYPSNKSEVQIALKNKDPHTRYLVQSWVSYTNDAKAPFIITPPFINCRKIARHFYTLSSPVIKKSARRSRIVVSGECEISLCAIA